MNISPIQPQFGMAVRFHKKNSPLKPGEERLELAEGDKTRGYAVSEPELGALKKAIVAVEKVRKAGGEALETARAGRKTVLDDIKAKAREAQKSASAKTAPEASQLNLNTLDSDTDLSKLTN